MQILLGSVTALLKPVPRDRAMSIAVAWPSYLASGMLQRATDLDAAGAEVCAKMARSVLAWATLASQIVAHPPHGGYPIAAPNEPAESFCGSACA